jgi:SNF2 family DNA or RNA helicase
MSRIFSPHEYQLPMMDQMRYNARTGIWAPMGGGKTVCTETVLDQLDLVEDIYPVLVLATKRVARTVWGPELKKWQHLEHLRASIVLGTEKERARALGASAEYFCTNYENLVWLSETLGDDWPFKTVVADELTKLKSFRLRQGTKRGKALAKYAHTKITRFIGLTGTPSPNGLKDLWGQTWFLDEGVSLGRTFTSFQERWFQLKKDGYGLEPMEHTEKEIHERIAKLYITVKGLPVDEPIFKEIYIDLPEKVRKTYQTMKTKAFAELRKDGKATVASNGGVRTSKLRQIANGFMFTGDPEKPAEKDMWEDLHDEKIAALESIIEEANGMPVLVAYNFKPDLAKLQKAFPQGRVLDDKQSTVDAWNRGEIPILFAHPASAGHGLNLQDGGNIIAFFGLDWNLELFLQIIERIGPLRQKQSGYDRPVFVYLIMARGTIEIDVWLRLRDKRSVQDILLAAMERDELGAPDPVELEPLEDLAA